MIETGFLNTDADNRLFDQKFQEIANAIATGIEKTITPTVQVPGTKNYRVQTGLFRRFGNAQYMLENLLEEGYNAIIEQSGEYFVVRVGDTKDLDSARKLEQQLQQLGYDTLIVTE